jgi:hypothetical protein
MGEGLALLGGELIYHFQNTAILTAVLAAFVLWRYRHTILRGMQQHAGEALPVPAPAAGAVAASAVPAHAVLAWERTARRRIALAYLLAVCLCALLLALVYAYFSGWHVLSSFVLVMALAYAMAAVPMIAVTLAWPFWRGAAAALALLVVGAIIVFAFAMVERSLLGRPIGVAQLGLLPQIFVVVGSQLWLPALLLLLTGAARLRGVAPITFAGLLVFGLAPLVGSRLTQWLAATETGTPWVLRLGLDGMFVMIALPTGWLAWRRLRAASAAYEAKRFSDAQLLARTWWLMLVATVALELATARAQPLLSALGCAAAYLAFAPASAFFLRRADLDRDRPPPRTLLLLRVFGYTARTERLFDRVGARWRLLGPVTMIAAPDVAARTIDPGDYLRYLTGRLPETFVRSRADLDARLAALDLAPDPDGRYRINELCCSNDTWRATVVELMARADAVVMDARGFAQERLGFEFELRELAARVPLAQVVLVVDASTDRALLAESLGARHAAAKLIEVEKGTSGENEAAFVALVEASSPVSALG